MHKSQINNGNKPSLDEMWKFIDVIMRPNELVPEKSTLTYEQVFYIYSRLVEIDEMFRELEQISILKKGINESKMVLPNHSDKN